MIIQYVCRLIARVMITELFAIIKKKIKLLERICRYSDYRQFLKKHLLRQIRSIPVYLQSSVTGIGKRIGKMPDAPKALLGGVPKLFIRGLMALFALLIMIDLIALAVLAVGKLAEPIVSMPTLNASINNSTIIADSINNSTIFTDSIKILFLDFWMIFGKTDPISLITILVALFAGMIFTSIFKKDEGLLVLPFNVEVEDKSKIDGLSGRVIQDQFIANLNKILWIHRKELERIHPEMVHAENVILPEINPKSESPTYDLSNLGTITTGPIGLSIGQILMVLREVCPGADPGRVIRGDLHQCGREIRLVATIGPKSAPKGSYSWNICRSFNKRPAEHKRIFELISDLCYQIAYEFVPDNSINNWVAFKYFTEARLAYHQYTMTEDSLSLNRARDCALKAANLSPKYEKLFQLIYNLGIAYSNKKWYKEAEALFRMNVILKRDSYEGYRGWGMALRRLDMNEMAFKCFHRAYDILQERHELHQSHEVLVHEGIFFRNQKDYDNAIECFEKALEINPDFAFAWGHMGNTLEAKSRYIRQKAIYKLLEFLRNINKNKTDVDNIKEEMDREELSDEEALQKLVVIVSESLHNNYKNCDALKESLDRLDLAIRKNLMAMEIVVKCRNLNRECKILAKLIRKITPCAGEFEDKCRSSAQDLIDLIDKNKKLLGDSGERLKMECNSICDLCEIIPKSLKTQYMKETLEDAGKTIEGHCIDIKKNALHEMQAAKEMDEKDALNRLRTANLIEEKGRVLKDKIKTLAASSFCTELDKCNSESEEKHKIIKKSWYIGIECIDLDELLSKYKDNSAETGKTNSEEDIKILDKTKKEIEDISMQCKQITEISKVNGRSSKIKAVKMAENIEKYGKEEEDDSGIRSLRLSATDETYASLENVLGLLNIPFRKHDALEEKVLKVLGGIVKEIDTQKDPEILNLAETAEICKKKALEAYLISINLNPEFIVVRSSLARLYAKDGQVKKMKDECTAAEKLIQKENEYNRTCHYAICGNIEDAFEPLRRALIRKQTRISWLEEDPDLEDLRKDSRFAKLREECKSEEEELISGFSRLAIYRKLHEDEERRNECTKLRKTIKSQILCNQAIFEVICNNDLKTALQILEDALNKKSITSDALLRDPDFELMRDEPEFRFLLEKFTPESEFGQLAKKL